MEEKTKSSIEKWFKNFGQKYFSDSVESWETRKESIISLLERGLKQMESRTGLDWKEVESIEEKYLQKHENIPHPFVNAKDVKTILSKVFVLKLNGGLGTSMGLDGPKSLLECRVGKGNTSVTFLDVVVDQLHFFNSKYDTDIPLVLMNSFYTHDHITKYLAENKSFKDKRVDILCFMQKKNPKLDAKTYVPIPTSPEERSHWNPPGHGDVYDSLLHSDVYKTLIERGKDIMFLSNVDNLGATLDLDILNHVVSNKIDFCLEVTKKTLNDVKGGTLIHYKQKNKEGKKSVKLLELAQVPKEHVSEFMSIEKFRVFNTNSMWVNIVEMKKQIANIEKVDIIFNKKTISYPTKQSTEKKEIVQLETACGAAIEYFNNSVGIEVARSRFIPVKKCQDLFLLQSDLFVMDDHFSLIQLDPEKLLPEIKFETSDWNRIQNYEKRIGQFGIPNISELKSLKLSGDVIFKGGKSIQLIGDVEIKVQPGKQLVIGENEVFENKKIEF